MRCMNPSKSMCTSTGSPFGFFALSGFAFFPVSAGSSPTCGSSGDWSALESTAR